MILHSGDELNGVSPVWSCCVFGSSMYDKMLWPVWATASRFSQQVETGRLLESAGAWAGIARNKQKVVGLRASTGRW
jgi:hypothetical protein